MNVDNIRAGRAALAGALLSLLAACADGDSTTAYSYPADPPSTPRLNPPVPARTTTDTTRDPSLPGADEPGDPELAAPGNELGSGGAGSLGLGGVGGEAGSLGVGGSYEDPYPSQGAAGLGGEAGFGGLAGFGGVGGSL